MSSMSVAQLPNVESPSHGLTNLTEHFDANTVHSLMAPYRTSDLSLDNDVSNLIIVQLPGTGPSGTAYRQTLSAVGEC